MAIVVAANIDFLEVERKRAYAKASQQAARDSLEMQRAANSEVGCAEGCWVLYGRCALHLWE